MIRFVESLEFLHNMALSDIINPINEISLIALFCFFFMTVLTDIIKDRFLFVHEFTSMSVRFY